MIIYLGRLLPAASSDLTRGQRRAAANIPLFGLAPGGVYLAGRSPGRWCALTAPFHPYPVLEVGSLLEFGKTEFQQRSNLQYGAVRISVALSLGSPPLGITQHPALRSSDFPQTPLIPGARDHLIYSLPYFYTSLYHLVNNKCNNRRAYDAVKLKWIYYRNFQYKHNTICWGIFSIAHRVRAALRRLTRLTPSESYFV